MSLYITALLAIAVGTAFGYVSKSGSFCMNSGFRNLLGKKDTKLFKAYILAIAIQMLILPLLQYFGVIKITVPVFYPLGAVFGGFIFGMAMNWSGGCAAGVWYKFGSGNIGSFVAVAGLIFGYTATESGILKSFRVLLQSVGKSNNIESLTLSSFANIPHYWLSLPISLILIFLLLKDFNKNREKRWNWQKTGLWIGATGLTAWLFSSLTERYFGMAIMPGSKQVHDLLTLNNFASANWDLFFVLGIPIGAYLSVVRSQRNSQGSFKWSNISGSEIWKFAAGGFVLGSSASLAGGCTVGHSLTGVPLLSIGSIVFTIFTVLGAWSGVIINNKLRRRYEKLQ